MTQLQNDILSLHTKGFTYAQISELLNCTPQHVGKTIRGVAATESTLTIPNYFKATSRGIKTQVQLAAFFGVSDRTIRSFEKKNNIRALVSAYYEFTKCDYLANLEKELTKISELLNLCNPNSPKLDKINQLIKVLKSDFLTNLQKQELTPV